MEIPSACVRGMGRETGRPSRPSGNDDELQQTGQFARFTPLRKLGDVVCADQVEDSAP